MYVSFTKITLGNVEFRIYRDLKKLFTVLSTLNATLKKL